MIIQTKFDGSQSHVQAEVRDNGLILINIRHASHGDKPGEFEDTCGIGFSPSGSTMNGVRKESTRADLRRWALALVAAIDADPEVN
jgi:hypothetical protein